MEPAAERLRALMAAWVDGEQDAQDHAQLQVALRDPELAREFLRTVHLHLALGRVARAQVQRQQFERPDASTRRPAQRHARRFRVHQARGWWVAACAALVLLAVAGMLPFSHNAPALVAGPVAIELSGVLVPPGAERDLVVGSLVTVPHGGTATLGFADGTRLTLDGDTRVRVAALEPGKRVELAHGALSATVAKQPVGAPLVIATPRAATTVVGTRLRVLSSRDAEQVAVRTGRVRVQRLADQARVEVAQDEELDLLAPGPLLAQRGPPLDGLQMWLDADQGAEADGAGLVGAWRDRSGHGRDLVQVQDEARPRLAAVGPAVVARHALVAFARPQDCLATHREWPPFTSFSVAGLLRPQHLSVWCQTFGCGWGHFAFHGNADGGVFAGVGLEPSPVGGPNRFTPQQLPPKTLAVGRWLRFALVHGPDSMSFSIDGREIARLPTRTAPAPWPGFTIGAAQLPGLGGGFQGDVAEMLVYDRALSADEVLRLDQRLRARAESTP